MEAYLNCIGFGNDIIGIKKGSLYYFDKQPEDLTQEEAAKLVAIIDNPSRYNPIEQKQNNDRKAKMILEKLGQE